MERQQISISLPEVQSHKYKITVKEIEELVRGLNTFTNNLEGKVNNMLKGQETEFVNSYKDHMHKVEECLKIYQNKIEDNQKIIQHYENEGMLANLLKKINLLQKNEKKLLTTLEKKDKAILILKGEISTQGREVSSLHEKIKQLLLGQPALRATIIEASKQSELTFATEVNTHSKYTLLSNRSIEHFKKENPQLTTIIPLVDNPQKSMQTQNEDLGRFKRQLMSLKKKNRELSSFNSKILDKASSIEEFFLKTINDLKKKIAVRKKFTSCSFEDFKQEDKLQLLIKVLSNDEILQHLYNKIFKKQSTYETNPNYQEKLENLWMTERVVGRLPAITSLRL